MLEGLDEALTGLSAEETTTFTSALVGGERAGEEAEITVTANVIKEQELPEVDDDFAQMASEHDTVEELRESLRTQALENKRNQQAIQARDKLIEHLQEAADFPIPTGMVEEEVTRHLAAEGREDDEEHGEEVRVETTKTLRRQLLLDVLAEQIDVQIGQDEVLEFMLNTARQYQMDPNELIQNASENGQMPAFIGEVTRNKSVAMALRQVNVVDNSGQQVDLTEYIGSDEEDERLAAQAEAQATAAASAEGATELVDVPMADEDPETDEEVTESGDVVDPASGGDDQEEPR